MLYITVHLYGRNQIPGEFREYETKALALFKKHGGEVIIAYSPVRPSENAEGPDEIQVLRIENHAAFERFMHDPVRLGLAGEREAVIRKTEVYLSGDLVEY